MCVGSRVEVRCVQITRVERDVVGIEGIGVSAEEHHQGLQQQELGARLKTTINGLKEPYRSLVVLRDVHQHSYEEVAAVLELNMPQVKTYLHRARKQLREQLAEVRP